MLLLVLLENNDSIGVACSQAQGTSKVVTAYSSYKLMYIQIIYPQDHKRIVERTEVDR